MKKNKFVKMKFIPLILALLLLFYSCDSKIDNPDGTDIITTDAQTTVDEILPITFFQKGKGTDYILIRPENASAEMQNVYSDLHEQLKTHYELNEFQIKTDWYQNGTDTVINLYEILVGNTNRPETESVFQKLNVNDYMIVVVGDKLVICGGSDEATKDAIAYFVEQYIISENLTLGESDTYCKSDAPILLSTLPEEQYYFEKNRTPQIVINYNCSPDVDKANTTVKIDDVDYTASTDINKDRAIFKDQVLDYGKHTLKLTLVDVKGKTLNYEYPFTVGDGTDLNLYCGELHAHTEESDGKGTVDEAYKYARDIAGLDYFSITDHSDSFTDDTYNNVHKVVADNYNKPGEFVSFYGYEQTYNISSGYFGHINVINSPEKTSKTLNLDPFYNKMSGITQAVGMFDHPGYTWGNFLEYDLYCQQYDSFMNLMEVKGSGYDTEYALSLTKGWHLSPVHNEDNHNKQWGTVNEAVGYALAGSLTRQNILEAFQQNRTYTTTDRTMKIYYSINNEWMGSRLDDPSSLKIKVELKTEKPAGLGYIYIVGEDNVVVASKNVGTVKSYTWELELPPLHDYYYVKVSNSSIWAVTAPIWIENRSLINITDIDMGLLDDKAGLIDHFAAATIQNNSTDTMSNITVKFYNSPYSGFDINKAEPFSVVNINELKAGESVDVSAAIDYDLSNGRITVTVESNIGENKYFDTKYMQLSQLYITEIVPVGKFEFIELYNNSDTELNLDGFSMRVYPKAGANSTDLANNTWKLSGVIPPHSTIAIWVTNTDETIADFNSYYKTSLVEGVSIIKIKTSVLIPSAKSIQIELLNNKTVIDRIWYNWGNRLMPIYNEKSITYEYQDSYTLTNKQTDYKATPTPGAIQATQVPILMKLDQWRSNYIVNQ